MAFRILIACTLAALACVSSAHASKVKPTPSPCAFAEDQPRCETKLREFSGDLPKANHADYLAQREVAFCYATGCHGVVSVDLVKACAWQTVIVSTEQSDSTDAFNYRNQCEQLSKDDRAIARNNALSLFSKIYRKLMTKPLPFEKAGG